MSTIMTETIVIRQIQLQDIVQLGSLFKDSGLDDGEHIFRLVFLNTDNSLWRVAVNETGEVIGTYRGIKLVLYGVSVVYGCRQMVRSDYQRRGINGRLREVIGNLQDIGNASMDALTKMSYFKKFSTKLVGYHGYPSSNTLSSAFPITVSRDFDVADLQEEDMEKLLAYDRTIFDYDRTKFMRAWCQGSKIGEPYSKTVIAKLKFDGQLLGFGTIRQFERTYKLVPVYAENTTVAHEILRALTLLYIEQHSQSPLRVYFDARNRTMLEYAKRLGFKHGYTSIRVCTRGTDEKGEHAVIDRCVKAESIYAYQSYWPV